MSQNTTKTLLINICHRNDYMFWPYVFNRPSSGQRTLKRKYTRHNSHIQWEKSSPHKIISPTGYFYYLLPLEVYTNFALVSNQEDNIFFTKSSWMNVIYITRWYKLPRSQIHLKYYFSTSHYIYESTKIALPSTAKKIIIFFIYLTTYKYSTPTTLTTSQTVVLYFLGLPLNKS
jgi:hypothetical protein